MDRKYWRAYIRAHVKVDLKTECWVWQMACQPNGYGHTKGWRHGLPAGAHRMAFAAFKGPIPQGKVVRHRCHNRPCCNPKHLLLGTQQDNMLDNLRDGRAIKMKLTPAKVARIKKLLAQGTLQSVLVAQFGISQTVISRINTGHRWANI